MKMRSEKEIDDLVSTARDLCEALAAYRCARDEGRLPSEVEGMTENTLSVLAQRLELLKSNGALDRERTKKRTHAIPLSNFTQKAGALSVAGSAAGMRAIRRARD